MAKLLSLALTVTLVVVAALTSADAYTALRGTTTTWQLASSPQMQQNCAPPPQACVGPMCGYPQPMPCMPQRITKCKPPACPPPACGPMPCYGYAAPCQPAPCPPPCKPQSCWDKLITNLWY